MDKYLEKRRKKGNGMYLCQLPTGYGKTYSIVQHMIGCVTGMAPQEKIVYITPLKKNLPVEELKKAFNDDEKYHDNVLIVRSVFDHYMDSYEGIKNGKIVIPQEFQSQSYKKLIDTLKQYETVTIYPNKSAVFNTQEIETKFAECERDFRKEIKNIIDALDMTPNVILKALKNPKHRLHWVGQLYPSIYIDDYKIIAMTVHKFFTPHISIVEPSYEYYSTKFLKDTTVFIDEFDATKSVIEDIIIKRSIERAAEIKSLFNKIYRGFNIGDFNKELQESITIVDNKIWNNFKSNNGIKNISTSRELIKKAEVIKNRYYTNLSYKLHKDKQDTSYKILFFDGEFLTINKEGKQFKCSRNQEEGQVDIDYMTEGDITRIINRERLEYGAYSLQECLYEIEQYLASMRIYINYWAQEYQGRNNQSKPDFLNEMLLEEAINTIGAKLNLTHHELKVLMGPERRSVLMTNEYYLRDPLIHEKGFSYYMCKDNNNHADTTKIECFRVPYTPEKYLLHMAKVTKVIGVSATAELDSVIGNYDLNYLKNALGEDFHPTPIDLKIRIQEELKEKYDPYKEGDVQVQVHLVGKEFEEKSSQTMGEYETQCIAMFKKAIQSNEHELCHLIPELVEHCSKMIQAKIQPPRYNKTGNNNYQIERYYKYIYNLIVFMTSDSMQSMLHLGMMLPEEGKVEYDLNLLNSLFRLVAKIINTSLINDKPCVLGGIDYEMNKETIMNRLSNGEKIFIISSYTTLGAGQNLKYKLVEGKETVTLGNYNESDSRYQYKDIDGIYLGEVTTILPNIHSSQGISNEEAIRRIMQIERLHNNYELDNSSKKLDIRNTFKSYSKTPLTGQSISVKTCTSYINAAQRTVIQALGRLCRTYQKSPNIYIGLDYKMVNKMNVEEIEKLIQTPELECLNNALKNEINYNDLQVQDKLQSIKKDKLQMKARIIATKTSKWILKQLEQPWTYESSRIWGELREFLLAHPTLSKEEYFNYTGDIPIDLFYLTSGECSNKYLYAQKGDYQEVYVSFQTNKNHFWADCKCEENIKSKVYEMSEFDSTLPDLLKYPTLQGYFSENNYAATFEPKEYMMAPAIFNNFYKGILGEEVGRYIWEKEIQVPLQAIHEVEEFEKFDFKIEDEIYIDFKNWSKGSKIDAKREHAKIKRKMEQIGAKLVFIVNVQGDENYTPRINKEDGIVEIPCLITKEGVLALSNINLIKEILGGEKDVIHK